MLNRLKKICRKNRVIFYLSRIVYIPIREVMLFLPKQKYKHDAIKKLQNKQKEKPTIYYFGVPIHKNLGDLAQTYCTLKYFEKYWSEYEVLAMQTYSTYSKQYRKLLKNQIRDEDIIFFQSGYCTKDEHLDHTMHKILLKEFKTIRIVFLPQTVLFKNIKEKNITSKIFNEHPRTLFLARDKISYTYAKEMFPKLRVECFPDIVTTLIGTEEKKEGSDGILLCVRNDYEQLYSKESIDKLRKKLYKISSKVEITDTSCEEYSYEYILKNLEKVIYSKINFFKEYKVVITDRYHGTIFSMIANVPVIVLASNDHKVKTGLDWFEKIYEGKYFLAKSPDEAYEIAKKILSKKIHKNQLYFEKKYYDNLRMMVERL